MSYVKYSLFNRHRESLPAAKRGTQKFDDHCSELIRSLEISIDGLNSARHFAGELDRNKELQLHSYLDQIQDMIDVIVGYGETINATGYRHIQLVLALEDLS